MFRAVAVLILVRLLSQATGADVCCDEPADDQCESVPQAPGTDCSPVCDDCLCCGHRRLSPTPSAVSVVPALTIGAVWFTPLAIPSAPDLDGLLRVPKRARFV